MSETFTPADVAKHKTEKEGLYIIVDGSVYNITGRLVLVVLGYCPVSVCSLITDAQDFVDEHPGGAKILKRMAGRDASKPFWKYHSEAVLKKYGPRLKVGTVKEAAKL